MSQTLGCRDQGISDTWFAGGVSGIGNYFQPRFGPGCAERKGLIDWSHHGIAAVHYGAWDIF